MTIIVQHVPTERRYLLVGSGYGAYRSSRPSAIFGSLAPKSTSGVLPVVLCADEVGGLRWIDSAELRVESVDGLSPAQALGERHTS